MELCRHPDERIGILDELLGQGLVEFPEWFDPKEPPLSVTGLD